MMNARLLLLVLVTGLFMAAWNGDQTAMEAAIVRRDVRIANARLALLQQQTGEVQTASIPADVSLEHSLTIAKVSDNKEDSTLNSPSHPNAEVPLPRGIAAGEYQAVNQDSGETQKLTVSETGDQATLRDFYTVDDDQGNRWYLIRIADKMPTRL